MSSTYQGATIASEIHYEEEIRLLQRHLELIWNRLRRRWATKHQLQVKTYYMPNQHKVYLP